MTYPRNTDLEVPLEDAAEQATSVLPDHSEDRDDVRPSDDDRIVDLEDDDYR